MGRGNPHLPALVMGVPEDDLLSTELPASLRGAETLLLVEDDAHVRRHHARAAQRYGYSVLEATGALRTIACRSCRSGVIASCESRSVRKGSLPR